MEQNPQNPSPSSQEILSWKSTSIPVHERGMRWYAIAITVLLAGVAYGLFTGAWSLSVVLLLCGVMYYLIHNHTPSTKEISIGANGVTFEGTTWEWNDLKGFWIIHTPINEVLHIMPHSHRKRDLIIQLSGVQAFEVKQALSPNLQEMKEKKESMVDIIIRLCKL